MELFTVVNKNDKAIKISKNIYVEKKEYDDEKAIEFARFAKSYYIKIRIISESTDFNDRYSDDVTRYVPCNWNNMVIKDGNLYGFIACGLEKYDSNNYVTLTFDDSKVSEYDGNCYSSMEKFYNLEKYDFNEEIISVANRYKLVRNVTYYKIRNGQKKHKETYKTEIYFTAFDVAIENDKPIGLKYADTIFKISDVNEKISIFKENMLGAQLYHEYYDYWLTELY